MIITIIIVINIIFLQLCLIYALLCVDLCILQSISRKKRAGIDLGQFTALVKDSALHLNEVIISYYASVYASVKLAERTQLVCST